ncbi:MAG: HIT family protein [bacterium]|nr:HIT family protein [bacterium]
MDDCLFCKIIAGTVPCEKIYEDEHVLAFLDIHPINRGHTVIIPKTHSDNIYNIPSKNFCDLMEIVRMLAPKVKNAVNADGTNIGMNNDRAAGQVVFHAHIHIIPRFDNDGHKHWYGTPYKEGEAQVVAEKIRAVVG